MPITPSTKDPKVGLADTSTPFNKALTTTDVAEDLVAVPSGKKGRVVSLINDGTGDVALAFDATATVADLVIREGEAYSDSRLSIATKISFINVATGETPTVRGILWSGD